MAVGAAAAIAIPIIAQQPPTTGPIARYDMRASTVSGMAAMGGGRPNPMAMMMGGRGDNVQHELYLRLGSSQAASGPPQAQHFMPPGAQLGNSVQLVTPREEPAPDEFRGQRPKGRMLIYWGCGEHAPAGQPVIIDFSKLAAGQVPPGLWSSTIIRDWGPTLQNSRSFGRWPADDGKFVKRESALPGPHRIAGNYTPEISFTLARDFMRPLSVRTAAQPSGAMLVSWAGVPDATGYLAFLFGGKRAPRGNEMGDMVMWTSSASRQFGGGLTDWLTPGQVAGLVRDRTVLAPSATSCTVPAEVRRDAADFRMGTLTAYGPMEDFAYPPRPANPKATWNIQWTARIRHRSTTSWMDIPGMENMGNMDMGAMDRDSEERGPQQQQQQQPCRPKRGLGGLLGGALGGGSGC
ncbi:hypothetical protein H7F51_17205 [Novosphingobium flavum]|uniref:Uncharacterized protein n=1 Tax=Novosphingobium flavum TaxID=1778672 RepID=A0A7X1KN27_9SPHN|nr:hypothetical protein [Novosphingobium flavum]